MEIPPGQAGYYSPSTIPSNAENGEYEFTFSVDDGRLISGTSRFTVTGGVEPPAPPPPDPEPDPEPTPPPAPSQLELGRIWIEDANGRETPTVSPGDVVDIVVQMRNQGSQTLLFSAAITVRGPTGGQEPAEEIIFHRNDYEIESSEQPIYYHPSVIPTNAQTGRYTVTVIARDRFTGERLDRRRVRITIEPEPEPEPEPTPRVVYSDQPAGQAPNLIVLVHGCCTDETNIHEWYDLRDAISQDIENQTNNSRWEIVVLDWHEDTPNTGNFVSDPSHAYNAARQWGNDLAYDIIVDSASGPHKYRYIHLIAHSAGARLIHRAAKTLVENVFIQRESPFLHLTFLDAFTPYGNNFGALSDYPNHYSEHYVDISGDLRDHFTRRYMNSAFNFDVTNIDSNSSRHEKRDFGHHWPRYWYLHSIESGFTEYGYELSREGGNRNIRRLRTSYPPGEVCTLPASCLRLQSTVLSRYPAQHRRRRD